MKKTENEKDIVVRMVVYYRQWYIARFGVPLQYSSQNAYVIEYNTMKGIYNMLVGSFRAKNPQSIPNDDIILGMWQRLLGYLTEKNSYYYTSLFSIHRSYNTITAQMMRHAEKKRLAEEKEKAGKAQLKINILQDMLQGSTINDYH
ncbi:MAG: hypothetical protein IJ894_10725 [Bacteroidales bacterium]|nr:hypothetical protein [Bacteroidales bacterium]MBR4273827.1 hypothetical protein [Bacteroidales bacterium]